MKFEKILESCPSTNRELFRLAQDGADSGSWIMARSQSEGRGRLGRDWVSGGGGLYFSFLSKGLPPKNWTWVPLAAAVAEAKAIEELFPRLSGRIKIKWPNDLMVEEAKLSGILCEAGSSKSREDFIVIGVGLNCNATPVVSDRQVTSLRKCLGDIEVLPDHVLPGLIQQLSFFLNHLKEKGPSEIRDQFYARSYFKPGEKIHWDQGSGEFRGLGESGELRVQVNGIEQRLFAEEVSVRKLT